MTDIQRSLKKEKIRFLNEFLDAAVDCGELSEICKGRLKENNGLKDFFDEGRDEEIEMLQDLARELCNLKAKIKGDGLEYLLQDIDENTYEGSEDKFKDLLEKCSDDYIQISTFKGHKEGYTFKTDRLGTGYYKNGVTFEESEEESEEGSEGSEEESEELTQCESCSRVWDGNAQCPCSMDAEAIFEGRTTFPSENNDETNQFILRYIKQEWPRLTYVEQNYYDEVTYKIYKRRKDRIQGDGYILSGKGYCGVISGEYVGSFILNLRGKPFEELDNVLCELL